MLDDDRTTLLDEVEEEFSQVQSVLDHLEDDEWVTAALDGDIPILKNS